MNNKNKSGAANINNTIGSPPILADMAEIATNIDGIFTSLEAETDNFVSKIVNGFHLASDFFESALKLLTSFMGGGKSDAGDLFSSLLGFLPGGGILSGFINLFSGLGGLMPHPGGMNSGAEQIINAPSQQSQNITVIVNSEIESAKAVKFLNNYMPVYNTRLNERTA